MPSPSQQHDAGGKAGSRALSLSQSMEGLVRLPAAHEREAGSHPEGHGHRRPKREPRAKAGAETESQMAGKGPPGVGWRGARATYTHLGPRTQKGGASLS